MTTIRSAIRDELFRDFYENKSIVQEEEWLKQKVDAICEIIGNEINSMLE